MEVIVRITSTTFHYIERPEIITLTRLPILETIARLGANIQYLYLILNNVCRDLKACNIPKDWVRREIRRLVFYCKYARHRATPEPKNLFIRVLETNMLGENSIRDFLSFKNSRKDIWFYLLFPRHINTISSAGFTKILRRWDRRNRESSI